MHYTDIKRSVHFRATMTIILHLRYAYDRIHIEIEV